MSPGFDEFVAARFTALTRLAFLLCGDLHLAEDLVQSALSKVYPRWEKFGPNDNVEGYVRKVIIRENASWWRRSSSREVVTATPSTLVRPEGVDDLGISVVEADAMWGWLSRLPRKQRTVLVLRYYLDLSHRDIAEMLGCSQHTVRSNASRGLSTLRQLNEIEEKEPSA